MAKKSKIGSPLPALLIIVVGIIFVIAILRNKNFLRFGSPLTAIVVIVDTVPGPIDMNEGFTVCAQALNGVVSGCQSGVNGPESEPERITINID